MELALSLGDQSRSSKKMKELVFCMGLGSSNQIQAHHHKKFEEENDQDKEKSSSSSDLPPLQLDLVPFSPPPHQSLHPPLSQRPFPWLSRIIIGESGSQMKLDKGLDVKPLTAVYDPGNGEKADTIPSSPPNNGNRDTSSFHMDFSSILLNTRVQSSKTEFEFVTKNMDYVVEVSERDQRVSRRAGYGGTSDEDDNGFGRKKLRLTKEQSDFLEDSFKEHNTLNPKQKQVLANQLNLRPRQVEVWFQNRRARTKLKQTEVDCEYLKTCCETLTEENQRLQKELQELRALKTFKPFYMQLPPTTLTMCPSCERVVTTTPASTTPVPKQLPSGSP